MSEMHFLDPCDSKGKEPINNLARPQADARVEGQSNRKPAILPTRSLLFYGFTAKLRDLERTFPYHCTASLFIQSPEILDRERGRDIHEPRISNFWCALSFTRTVFVNALLWRMSTLWHRLPFGCDDVNFRLFALRRQKRDNIALTSTANWATPYITLHTFKVTKQVHEMFYASIKNILRLSDIVHSINTHNGKPYFVPPNFSFGRLH